MLFHCIGLGNAQVQPCPDVKTADALEAAYGDSRCVMYETFERMPFDHSESADSPSYLAEYLAENFERTWFRRSTPEDLGTCILGQYDFAGNRAVLWQEVVSLAADSQGGDTEPIRRFCRKWGSLGYPRHQQPAVVNMDPWGWCLAALRWFREATTLHILIQEGRTQALWERFGPPRKIDVFSSEARDAIFPRRRPFYDWRDYVWRYDTPDVSIEKDGVQCWVTPRDDSDLYRVSISLLQKAVSLELQKIPLVPLYPHSSQRLSSIAWGFYPEGAFHAALLQWFFQNLAGTELQTCAAANCDNPVHPPRKKYCSPQCEMRTRKANDRARQAMARELHKRGKGVEEIRQSLKRHFDMKNAPSADTVRGWIGKTSRERSG